MNRRAAIYVRVSRAYKEDDERVTIAAQLADCEAYCQERGYVLVARYIDKDKYRVKGALVNPSGTRKDPPAYVAMLKAACAGDFDIIVAWKEDRLYRGMYAALPLSEVLDERRNSLTVELVKENFDQKMLGLKAVVAKFELDSIRDRMIMGRKVRIERGEPAGGPVKYGYYKDENKRLVIHDEEACVIRKIYDLYNQGENSMEIRRRLNAAGIKPRKNKVWSKATIANILTFEGYATGKYTTTLDGETFTTACPPIIPMNIWEKSLEVHSGHKKYRGRNVKEDYLCRGMVTCLCGWNWTVRTCYSQGQTGKCGYYGCARKDHQPDKVHQDCPGTIGSKKLDNFVWNFVVTICQNPEIVQNAIEAKIARLREQIGDIEHDVELLEKALTDLSSERQWVITMARKGKITDDDMDDQLSAIDFQSMEFHRKLDDKLSAIVVQQQTDRLKDWANQYLSNMVHGLRVLDVNPSELGDIEKAKLYQAFDAQRFEEKFNGDKFAALRWGILEEKRRAVRMLVSKVLVVKDPDGSKRIIPQLSFELSPELVSLVYDDQSLAYVEKAKELIGDDYFKNGWHMPSVFKFIC